MNSMISALVVEIGERRRREKSTEGSKQTSIPSFLEKEDRNHVPCTTIEERLHPWVALVI